jgi:hypothetical protein
MRVEKRGGYLDSRSVGALEAKSRENAEEAGAELGDAEEGLRRATGRENEGESNKRDSHTRRWGSKSGKASEVIDIADVEVGTSFPKRGCGIEEFWISGRVRGGGVPCFPRLPHGGRNRLWKGVGLCEKAVRGRWRQGFAEHWNFTEDGSSTVCTNVDWGGVHAGGWVAMSIWKGERVGGNLF